MIQVNGLDEGAIENWWNSFKNSNQYSTLGQNCSTTAADALNAGGGLPYAILGGYGVPPLVWSPSDVLDYANAINSGLNTVKFLETELGPGTP